jgi:hypothetical protein
MEPDRFAAAVPGRAAPRGRWEFTVGLRGSVDQPPPGATSCGAKVDAGQTRPRGRARRRRRVARGDRPPDPASRTGDGAAEVPNCEGVARAARSPGRSEPDPWPRCFGRGTIASPTFVRVGSNGVRAGAPRDRRSRVRRPCTSRRSTPYGYHQPEVAVQTTPSPASPDRYQAAPGDPVAPRVESTGRSPPGSLGTLDDFDRLVARGRQSSGSRSRSTSRICRPRPITPLVAEKHPRVVLVAAGTVSIKYGREPAQALSGHRQLRLSKARRPSSCGRRCAAVVVHWNRPRGAAVPAFDNPHTKPFAFGSGLIEVTVHRPTTPRSVFLAAAFTRPGGDGHPRQARLQPVANTLLHVAVTPAGELEGSTSPSWRGRPTGSLAQLLREHAPTSSIAYLQEGGRPAFGARTGGGGRAARDVVTVVGHVLRLRAGRRGRPSTSGAR